MSDDACGSGNYTVQMSLRPAAEADPEAEGSAPSQETFLALLAVQSNGSQPVLQVRSCCVTPSASPGGPGATCCVFRRSGAELRRWARRHTGLWGWAGNGLIPGGRLQQPPAFLLGDITAVQGWERRASPRASISSSPSHGYSCQTHLG